MIERLISLSTFELEYQHRAKSNPFSEKWINSTRSRARLKKIKKFLYELNVINLNSDYKEEFYQNVLRPIVHEPMNIILNTLKFDPKEENKKNILYEYLFYKIKITELFILFSKTLAWEHQRYPGYLEYMIYNEKQSNMEIKINDQLLRYYIRLLDVLSSSEIVSLFDLDALRNIILTDKEEIGKGPLISLHLFEDWPKLNTDAFTKRFPDFKEKLADKIFSPPPIVGLYL